MGTISGAGTAYHSGVHLWFSLRFVLLNLLFVVLWTLACYCVSFGHCIYSFGVFELFLQFRIRSVYRDVIGRGEDQR